VALTQKHVTRDLRYWRGSGGPCQRATAEPSDFVHPMLPAVRASGPYEGLTAALSPFRPSRIDLFFEDGWTECGSLIRFVAGPDQTRSFVNAALMARHWSSVLVLSSRAPGAGHRVRGGPRVRERLTGCSTIANCALRRETHIQNPI
jgi:hypothetical protein